MLKIVNTPIELNLIYNCVIRAIELTENNNVYAKIVIDKEDKIYVNQYGTTVFKIHGGLNGYGEWKDYFSILSELMKNLEVLFQFKCWLIELQCDPLDDIFWGTFGIKYKE